MNQTTPPDPWFASTWKGNDLDQLRRAAAIPFARKVEILEEVHRRFLVLERQRLARVQSPSAAEQGSAS